MLFPGDKLKPKSGAEAVRIARWRQRARPPGSGVDRTRDGRLRLAAAIESNYRATDPPRSVAPRPHNHRRTDRAVASSSRSRRGRHPGRQVHRAQAGRTSRRPPMRCATASGVSPNARRHSSRSKWFAGWIRYTPARCRSGARGGLARRSRSCPTPTDAPASINGASTDRRMAISMGLLSATSWGYALEPQ